MYANVLALSYLVIPNISLESKPSGVGTEFLTKKTGLVTSLRSLTFTN